LTTELTEYLVTRVGVAPSCVTQICNGVDVERFRPADRAPAAIDGCPFDASRHWLVGTVGRMQAVKDQVTLARAFALALQQRPALMERMRLVMIGDGPLRALSQALLDASGIGHLAWLPGERGDVAEVMRGLNCFVLPSLAEGVSNTILEAMASGLPVIATAVGANADLVEHGETGEIVSSADAEALAASIVRLATNPERAAAMGRAGRASAEDRFSLGSMVSDYQALYDERLRLRKFAAPAPSPRS
jgi:sugar transferase (PEP-CTERM/EpsH1 system associated)